MSRPIPERVAELLSYDPETGVLTWLVDGVRHKAGDRAGVVQYGNGRKGTTTMRHEVSVEGYVTTTGRLAVVLMEGRWPEGPIMHANGDPLDCRWENLVALWRGGR